MLITYLFSFGWWLLPILAWNTCNLIDPIDCGDTRQGAFVIALASAWMVPLGVALPDMERLLVHRHSAALAWVVRVSGLAQGSLFLVGSAILLYRSLMTTDGGWIAENRGTWVVVSMYLAGVGVASVWVGVRSIRRIGDLSSASGSSNLDRASR